MDYEIADVEENEVLARKALKAAHAVLIKPSDDYAEEVKLMLEAMAAIRDVIGQANSHKVVHNDRPQPKFYMVEEDLIMASAVWASLTSVDPDKVHPYSSGGGTLRSLLLATEMSQKYSDYISLTHDFESNDSCGEYSEKIARDINEQGEL